MLSIHLLPSRSRFNGGCLVVPRAPAGVRGPSLRDLTRDNRMNPGGPGSNTSSRVVMVRKTEQRTFKTGEIPQFQTVTRETVETFRGNRSERITTSEERDVFEDFPSELRSSLGQTRNGSPTDTVTKPGTTSVTSSTPVKKNDGKLSNTFKSKSSDTISEGDFASDCLKAHNEYRQLHGVPSLKLNKKLCKFSEEWAKRLASRGVMEHRQGSEYGENIFCVWNSNPNYAVTGREPVENWYNEIKDHVFGREPTNLKTGHFTQVVWKDSKELGVAFAKSAKTGQIFVVANYSPPGNYVGNYTENVFPIGGTTEPKTATISSPTSAAKASSVKNNSGTVGFDSFEVEGLRVHNEYRRKHGVPEMTLNREICNYAKDWATLLVRDNKFNHRKDGKYGENLYTSWSSDPNHKVSATDACSSWYDEIKDHTFGVEPRTMKSGHFTQMIWKGSTELGIAVAKANGRVIIVANYNPRGNYIGQFAANCPKPR